MFVSLNPNFCGCYHVYEWLIGKPKVTLGCFFQFGGTLFCIMFSMIYRNKFREKYAGLNLGLKLLLTNGFCIEGTLANKVWMENIGHQPVGWLNVWLVFERKSRECKQLLQFKIDCSEILFT